MKNVEIIALAKMAAKIPDEIEVDTMRGWNRRGKKVVFGNHPVFRAKIWIPCTQKEAEEKTETDDEDGEVEEVKKVGRLYFKKVATNFFTEEQVK